MSQAADSAGIPFDGREFHDHPFKDDDGSKPVALGSALDGVRQALSLSDDGALARAAHNLAATLRTNRVLVPLIAQSGERGVTDDGRVVDKSQELSIVTVEGPTGQPTGLMFSSVGEMSAWRKEARPIPVEASRVAAWALTEKVPHVVVDAGSAKPVVCRRGILWSLVSDDDYVAPWQSEAVVEALTAQHLWGSVPGLVGASVGSGWRLDQGAGPDVVVTVTLEPGLDRAGIDKVTQTIAAHWAGVTEALTLVDGIRMALISAGSSPGSTV
jgi:hypothetical protein